MVEVPETIKNGFAGYRDVFCRDEGFDYVSRYVTALVISPNKTLKGIYDIQFNPAKLKYEVEDSL